MSKTRWSAFLSPHRLAKLPVRTQLIWLIVIVLVPTFVVFSKYLANERERVHLAAHARVQAQADSVAASLGHYFSAQEAALSRLALRPQVRQLNAHDCDPLLTAYTQLHAELANLAVQDLHGDNDCEGPSPAAPRATLRATAWFQRAIEQNTFAVGEVHASPLSGVMLAELSHPIRDAAGQPTGLLLLSLDLARLNRQIFSAAAPDITTTVLDAAHNVVLQSAEPEKWIGKAGPDKSSAQTNGLPSGLMGVDGVRGLFVVTNMPKTGWRVVAGLREDAVFAETDAALRRSVTFEISLLLIALALAWLISRGIARPVEALAATVAKLAEGNGSARAPRMDGPPQITTLIDAFNHMLDVRDHSDALLRSANANLSQQSAALLDSEQSLAITLHSMGDAVVATNAAGLITRMNPTAERLTGWPLNEALGRPLTEVFRIINAETRQPSLNPVQRVIAHGQTVALANHTVLLARDGLEYQISDSAAPIRNAAGHIVGVVLVFSDVTDKYRADAALREREAMLRKVVDGFGPSVFVGLLKPDGHLLMANQSALTAAGLVLGDVLGLPVEETPWFTHSASTQQQLRAAVERAAQGEPSRFDLQIKGVGEKAFIWLDFSIQPVRDATGKVTHLVPSALVIQERKQAEDAARESEQRFRDLVDSTDGIVWEADARNFAFTSVSGNAERMLGYPVQDWLSPGFWAEHLHEDDRDHAVQHCAACTARLEDHVFEYRFIAKDGREVWLRDIVKVVAQEGRARWIRGVMFDVTQERQRDEELESHRHSLETLVAQRTTELSAALLQADAANRAKSSFLANMSHEIRTPLNAIMGLNHLLRRDGATPEQCARLDKIDSASEHLLHIINDVLDLSKIEASQLQLESTNFHLTALLDHVQSIIADAARGKNINVEVDASEAPAWLRGDPTRLTQALLNFAVNAVKFTEHGTVALRAQLLEQSSEGLLVKFSVTDSGIGLDEDQQSRLFQAFAQADTSTTRKYGGTGLGLTITQRLAHLMGGEAGVESTPGVGSTFWFTACVQPGQGGTPAAPMAPSTTAQAQLRQRHGGAKILLAEDNEVNREVALAMLQGAGLSADTATNGREALAMAEAGAYDLILMDVQMPEMNGLDATRAIHALLNGHAPTIVALTANAFDDDRRACIAAGMSDVIVKPMNVNALYAALLHWLDASVADVAERAH
jgi:PAS domain S-box-containing protein